MASSGSQLVIGYLSAFGDMVASTSCASFTQALQGAIPDFELSFARSLVQAIFYFIGGKLAGDDFKITKQLIPGLLYLGLARLLYNVGYYGATVYLPLTEVFGVLVIAQNVSALLHSRLVHHKSITKSKIISLLMCVVGILLVAQPPWLFNQKVQCAEVQHPVFKNVSQDTPPISHYANEVCKREVFLGYMLSVLGGAVMGLMYDINGIILKDLTPIVKVTYGAGLAVIGSVAFMFYMEDPVLMMSTTQFMLVLGHGILSVLESFLFVQAAHYIPGPTLSAIYSLQMVFMVIYQYTIMHSVQPGNYNWIEVLGCIIIIIGASIPPIVDIMMHRAKSNELP